MKVCSLIEAKLDYQSFYVCNPIIINLCLTTLYLLPAIRFNEYYKIGKHWKLKWLASTVIILLAIQITRLFTSQFIINGLGGCHRTKYKWNCSFPVAHNNSPQSTSPTRALLPKYMVLLFAQDNGMEKERMTDSLTNDIPSISSSFLTFFQLRLDSDFMVQTWF